MKYMLMMFGGQQEMMETKSQEWIRDMIKFMIDIDKELRESGELVDQHGLADPSQAKTVRIQDGTPVVTDGPYAEYKESIAGYWVVECDEARAIDIVKRVVAFTGGAMEIRQAMSEPPPELL